MTRGNQREIDRARAEARHAHKGTSKDGDFLARKVPSDTGITGSGLSNHIVVRVIHRKRTRRP
jgi:hypothetical protein